MADSMSELAFAAIESSGFDCRGSFSASAVRVREEVRDMCAADRCRQFGHNWACPPTCGDLSFFRDLIGRYSDGIVFQTVGNLEDDFDVETMMDMEQKHKRQTDDLLDELTAQGISRDGYTLLSAGTCTRCKPCAFPDACNFPDKRLVSMEAAGLVVTEVCEAAGIPYNHGPQTIAYSSCILFNQSASRQGSASMAE